MLETENIVSLYSKSRVENIFSDLYLCSDVHAGQTSYCFQILLPRVETLDISLHLPMFCKRAGHASRGGT
jgi:hypothetical protein